LNEWRIAGLVMSVVNLVIAVVVGGLWWTLLAISEPHRTPVPLQRWQVTTLSPFFSVPLPSQFLHFCFFLMLGPFSLAMAASFRCGGGRRCGAPWPTASVARLGSLASMPRFTAGKIGGRKPLTGGAHCAISARHCPDERSVMISRRALVLAASTALLGAAVPGFAQAPTPNDPLAIINAIYARAAKGKGDGGGGFVTADKAARAKYLSKSLAALWAKAEAHTPKGDVGPIDFDPVTNSQEPDVKSVVVTAETTTADSATIMVRITGYHEPRPKPADSVIRYAFVRDGGHWKIDDIASASDGEPWSIRGLLGASLKG
jgi:hypothetical protein